MGVFLYKFHCFVVLPDFDSGVIHIAKLFNSHITSKLFYPDKALTILDFS